MLTVEDSGDTEPSCTFKHKNNYYMHMNMYNLHTSVQYIYVANGEKRFL